MSLVNDVLEDLSRREKQRDHTQPHPLDEVELSRFGVPIRGQRSLRPIRVLPWTLGAAGALVLLFEAVSAWQPVVSGTFRAPAVSARPPVEITEALSGVDDATSSLSATDPIALLPSVAPDAEYEELHDVDVRSEDGYTRVFFHLSGEREYWLQGDPAHGEIEIVISGTRLATAFAPFAFEGSGLQLQEAHNTSNGLHLLISFEPAARIQSQVVHGDTGPVLVVDVIDRRERVGTAATPPPSFEQRRDAGIAPAAEPVEAKAEASGWGVIEQTRPANRVGRPDAFASFDRGQQYSARGRKKEAIAEYVRALAIDPDLHRAREALVVLLIETEHFQAADRHLAEAMARAPEHGEYNFLNAQLLVATRQNDRAIAILESLPTPAERRSDALNLLAALYQQRGDHERAETLFRHAVQLAPHEARLWMGLGISLEGQQRMTEALAVYKQADSLARFETGPRRWLRSRIRELASLE